MRNSKGFSLIEILVALVLTTIGILGMVAMQSRSIQYTQDSVQRNAAVVLTNDLIEIMRANPTEIFEKSPPAFPMHSGLKGTSLFYKAEGANFSSVASCVASATVVPSTAKEQRDCWIENLKSTLPGAADLLESDIYVCRSSSPKECDGSGSLLEIQLAWRTKENACLDAADIDSTVCTYRVRVEL